MSIETKLVEILDEGTCIAAVATRLTTEPGRDRTIVRRAGFAPDTDAVLLAYLSGGRTAEYNVRAWGDRTMSTAHQHLRAHWDEIEPGAVIDVEYLLGETDAPRASNCAPSEVAA